MTHEEAIKAAQWLMHDLAYTDYGQTVVEPDAAEKIIQAYLSASGMVLVPREPTERMVNAGYGSNHFGDHDPHYAYVRMIADAPDPFKSKPSPVDESGHSPGFSID